MNFDSHQTTGRESEAEEILKEISETLDRNDLTMSEGIPAEAEEEDTGAKERRLYTLGVRNSKQLREIAKNKQPYLVQDYIPPRSVGMLVGEWGIGKSPFAQQLQMTMAIGGGASFLERYKCPDEPCRTLYVDFENGPEVTDDLIRSLSGFLGQKEPPPTWETYSPNYSKVTASDAKYEEDHARIERIIKEGEYAFVIIDPLRMFSPEAEGKNTDAARVIKELRGLARKSGSAIMLVHHPHKPRLEAAEVSLENDPHAWLQRASGAAGLVQNVDFRIGLAELPDHTLISRSFVRGRGWGPAEGLVRVFDDDGDPIGYRIEGGWDKLPEADKQALERLGDEFTTKEAKQGLSLSARPTNDRLLKWVSLGLTQKVKQGLWRKTVEGRSGEQPEQVA